MSRDLDALVAEKVMGWRRTGHNDHTRPRHRILSDGIGDPVHYEDYDAKGPHDRLESADGAGSWFLCGCPHTTELPPFSSDIAAAWQVVETMRANGLPEWRLTGGRESNKVYAWFDTGEGQEDVPEDERTVKGWGYDPSAPRAICLAALRAVGVPIPETP